MCMCMCMSTCTCTHKVMNDDPAATDVLYARVQRGAAHDALQAMWRVLMLILMLMLRLRLRLMLMLILILMLR